MKYILSTFLTLMTITAFAQDCTKESLRKKPGTWKEGPQGSIHDVTAADLIKEKAVMAAIHKMITTNYTPTGCQVGYSNMYGKYSVAGQNWVADPYNYTMHILRYLCDGSSTDKSKYYVDYSTPTNVSITANVVFSLNNLYAATIAPDEVRSYLKLKQKPEEKEGVWYMGEEVVADYGTPGEVKEYRWLITYNDTLPFYYVSRKEYLLIQKKRLEKSIQEVPSEKEYTNKYLNNVNEYLKRPETELSLPAICMWNEEERFEKFVDEGTRGSFFAVKPNLDYYHKKLPKSSPQFFTVVYKIAKGDAVFADNYEAIKKAVDFTKLKNMLGK
ncbi:hypothetical protein [Pinibacter soli]|uniref:Uncharacterized protein n=1 Tax=Pinibacter soli TaxID=3044211 RepID=A0ABT6RDY3_9BACT|nr:hypothetical protein [Pinibacter soli]MDI3320686.1 hypothetical protein [Pinibacter soli]